MSDGPIDIDKRRAALKEIDDAKFGWYHIRACLVAGTGFFMDAYDLFAVNFASAMIGYVYYGGKIPTNVDMGLKMTSAVGTLLGQLIFGFLADILGRKKMYGIELMIIIIATVGSSTTGTGYGISLVGTIMFWRIIMGLGIGGDYPLSAIITSEFATKKRRGAMMAAVFSMQGFGILAAGIVALTVLAGFKNAIIDNIGVIDYCWRIVFGMGAVPGLLALYFRLTIPETPRYTMDVASDIKKATKDITSYLNKDEEIAQDNVQASQPEIPKSSISDFTNYFGKWKNGKILVGTAVSWFCLDIAFYGLGLNNGVILSAIGFADIKDPDNPNLGIFKSLNNMAVGNIIITAMGTIPGYWFTVFTVDKWGRKPIQIMGFTILTVLFIAMGAAFEPLKEHNAIGFIILFTLSQFFQNFGPNTTTFIVPGEVFPTRYRSTGHGISAAAGKLGAIVAQVIFSAYKDVGGPNKFVGKLLLIFSAFMFIGLLASFLIPETKGKSLEELANEDFYENDSRRDAEKA